MNFEQGIPLREIGLPKPDRRFFASNDRVAAEELAPLVRNVKLVRGEIFQVITPVAKVHSTPRGEVSCELLFGHDFRVLETKGGWCFGQIAEDGYVGYISQSCLGKSDPPTHWVCTVGSTFYSEDSIKSEQRFWIPFGAKVFIETESTEFAKSSQGYFLPKTHLFPLGQYFQDYVAIAQQFLGCQYLWGGQTHLGIDCSGLVKTALNACGFSCSRDSDVQADQLGSYIPSQNLGKRGDLVFWKGHVGILLDKCTILHANASTMSVSKEPLEQVCQRIFALEGDTYLGIKSLS